MAVKTLDALGTAVTSSSPTGRQFWKMSGSGNDFVFFDVRRDPPGDLGTPQVIGRLCSRHAGIGADGIVFLQNDDSEAFRIRYFNRDGSLAELCGNASLCSARLAVELGLAPPAGFRFRTDSGVVAARLKGAQPEIDLPGIRGLRVDAGIPTDNGERRLGYAIAGVPHIVAVVEDVANVRVEERGRALRRHPAYPDGANVNFVSPSADGRWAIRTYERGVEAETLACGTGSVASAVLLDAWGLNAGGGGTALSTRSGNTLTVTVRHQDGQLYASLSGEGRLVFRGTIAEI